MRKRISRVLAIAVLAATLLVLAAVTTATGHHAGHHARAGVNTLRHGTAAGQRAPVGPRTAGIRKIAVRKPAEVKNARWTGTWAASPQKPERLAGFRDVTLRLIIRTTIGGRAIRIRLSNEFGIAPLEIGAATVGVQSHGATVKRGTLRRLTFDGDRTGATIRPGAQVTSDGVPEKVPADTNLAVSLYLPVYTGPATEHADRGTSHQTSYMSAEGDYAGDLSGLEYPKTTRQWFFLDGVDVDAPGTSAVVALGDSITDGTASANDANHRYPDWLADRFRAAGGRYARLSVLNAGVGGNELLRPSVCCGASPSALQRLRTDVLGQSGVRDVIVLLGTNDIFRAHHATAPQIIAGLKRLIARLHAARVRVIGGTILPSSLFRRPEERTREAVNHWILTSHAFDGTVDFARAVADPRHPARLSPVYDSGGHLHPNDAGYRAMADAVNLRELLGKRKPLSRTDNGYSADGIPYSPVTSAKTSRRMPDPGTGLSGHRRGHAQDSRVPAGTSEAPEPTPHSRVPGRSAGTAVRSAPVPQDRRSALPLPCALSNRTPVHFAAISSTSRQPRNRAIASHTHRHQIAT